MQSILTALCAAFTLLVAGTAGAQQWGDLAMTFVYEGQRTNPSALDITTDKEFCGQFHVVDESLTINPANQGIANVMVWLVVARGDANPQVHPSYADTAQDKLLLDNNKCRFAPHALALRTSQTLIVGNSDAVGHNCKIDTFTNPPINYTIPAGGKFEHRFTLAERLPARVSCSIHPWMSGWLLVREDPYMGVSDADGRLVIKNVPAGTWTFQLWQEKAGYIDQATQGGQAVKWPRGRMEITIQPGMNDLGEVRLSSPLFAD